ncbi:MAG: ABC transporter permease [Verrucomicrobiota bacterium]|jgi:phospholipid/cholesterol/gamma-HCH transport system permease protein
MKTTASIPNLVAVRTSPGVLLARVSGNWREGPTLPGVEVVRETLSKEPSVKSVEFDTAGLTGWDSRFVAFISQCAGLVRGRNIEIGYDGLPEGARRLLRLAQAVPEKVDAHRTLAKVSFFRSVGERTIQGWDGILGLFTFLGQNLMALVNLLRGRAQFRWADAFLVMEQTGPQALGIVAMINFLVGLILAFVGALELERFGASIYVADLVGIATVREMGCIMTGIILCGRTGAAFAAQLGTMKVNEEISALETFGLSPIEFLVLPRMVALVLMMPFLCVFADLISIAGGFFVSVSMLDITSTEYVNRTIQAIQFKSFLLGIVKGTFFGFLVAYTGCLRGIQSGHTAAAVGQATTRAVVSGISAIIATDGIFAVLCNALHI